MLLKDCPVGSEVRLVSINGVEVTGLSHPWWEGSFEVKRDDDSLCKYVIDGDGDKRLDNFLWGYWRFEIVGGLKENIDRTITINGKTYKLKPHTEPRLTVIDGVTYEMEEQE